MHANKTEETQQLNFDAALAEIDRQERQALRERQLSVKYGMSTALVDAALQRLMDQRIALAEAYLSEQEDDIPASAQQTASGRGAVVTLTTLMLILATVVAAFAGVV